MKKIKLKFSIRALLLFVIVLSIPLIYMEHLRMQINREQKFLRSLRTLEESKFLSFYAGHQYPHGIKPRPGPEWVKWLYGERILAPVKLLNVGCSDSIPIELVQFNKLKSLESLSWNFGNYKSLDGLEALVELRDLSFCYCDSLINIDAISNLDHLHTLDLSGSRSLNDLRPLAKLPSLINLNIKNCESIEDIDFLKSKPDLIVYVDGCTNLKNAKWWADKSSKTILKRIEQGRFGTIQQLW